MVAKLINQVLVEMTTSLSSNQLERLKSVLQQTFEKVELIEKTESDTENVDISIIHTHFISMRHYLSVRLAAQFTGVRIIMHFHNHSMEAFGIKRGLRRKIYDNCEMIACSESVFQNLLRDYPDNRKYSIDNGVDYSRFDQNKTAGRDEYSLPKSK